MSIQGLHITQIGRSDFLLEPSRSLNIRDKGALLESIAAHLKGSKAARLYYDLSDLPLIDPMYYSWLEALCATMRLISVKLVCIHMQPTAAFAMTQFLTGKPCFETAGEIQDW